MPAKPLRHRRGRAGCLVVPVAAVLVAAAPCDRAAAQLAGPTLSVAGDSVIVGNPPPGQLTVRVTRPDPLTGRPVVIGAYSGPADSSLPFTVNTTSPTPQNPDGDCWQAGALSQALTPDIRPGDTVTMTGEPGPFGTAIPPMSVTAPAESSDRTGGPIPECRSIAPFAQNAATAASDSGTDGPIDVSGIAQPLATGVSASVSDGTHSTPQVDVTPKADGTWSATVPGDQVGKLSDGSLTVRPVFAVPDVGTGATVHVAGAPISVRRTRSGGLAGGPPSAGQVSSPGSEGGQGTTGAATRVSRLVVRSPLPLARARRDGLSVSFVVPEGARVIDVRLVRGRRAVLGRLTPAEKPGALQTVRLRGSALRRVLRRGRYTLAVRAGVSGDRLGTAVQRTIRVR